MSVIVFEQDAAPKSTDENAFLRAIKAAHVPRESLDIVALDLSLTSTGVAAHYGSLPHEQPNIQDLLFRLTPKNISGLERLAWIRASVLRVCTPAPAVVVIEGYAFSAHGSHSHEIGEVGGVVRMALYDARIPIAEVPPACLKLFASGKGNAKKEQVLADAVRKLGYQGHSTDEADALWLLQMARTHYASSPTNDEQRRALAKIVWPQLSQSLIGEPS